jgi:hypothetical protein
MKTLDTSAHWIESIIEDFVETSLENTLQNPGNDRACDSPLVGFSSGADSLYLDFKDHVGPFHWTPIEAFALAFPELKVAAEDLSVISWVLPQTEATKKDNRKERIYPSESWARNRIFGQEFNVKVSRHVIENLMKEGHEAVDPLFLPEWKIEQSERFTFSSRWSERHAAYASGLGTFGLCDGLITARGKAMRLGSVIARIAIPPTPRPYANHHEYCLFYSTGACRKCIERCPVNAVSADGHDKVKCHRLSVIEATKYVKSHYGFDGYGCGLCQTGVPCESGIPVSGDETD